MLEILKWCNDNQGVLAAIAILIVIFPAVFKIIPKCIKQVIQKKKKEKEEAHNQDLEAIKSYLEENIVASTEILAKKLNKSKEDIIKLLSELIDQGIVAAACDGCKLSDTNSIWELRG